MTDKPYDFKTQLAIGQKGEAFLDTFFAPDYQIAPVTMELQRQGIDRIFTSRHTRVSFSVEYKSDAKARKTHNAFVELTSVDKTDKAGWAHSSKATFLIYYVPGDELIYVVRFTTLRKSLPAWGLKYPLKPALNDGYRTWGLLVPLHEFEQIADHVYSA